MRYLLFLPLFLMLACHNEPENIPDASRIEGHWQSMIPDHPDWKYDFHDGLLHQQIDDFGIVVAQQDYVYAVRGDTIFISGTGGQRTWVTYFPCDSLVRVFDITAQVSASIWLKRR